MRHCCSERAWPACDSGIVNPGSRVGHGVAIARNPYRRFPDVACPTAAVRLRGKVAYLSNKWPGCASVWLLCRLPESRLMVPAQVGFPRKARLWPITHRHPPGPFPRKGPQSRRSLAGASP